MRKPLANFFLLLQCKKSLPLKTISGLTDIAPPGGVIGGGEMLQAHVCWRGVALGLIFHREGRYVRGARCNKRAVESG